MGLYHGTAKEIWLTWLIYLKPDIKLWLVLCVFLFPLLNYSQHKACIFIQIRTIHKRHAAVECVTYCNYKDIFVPFSLWIDSCIDLFLLLHTYTEAIGKRLILCKMILIALSLGKKYSHWEPWLQFCNKFSKQTRLMIQNNFVLN